MKQRTITALVATAAIAMAGAAQAGAEVGSWYVAPKAMWVDPDKAYGADEDFGYGLAIGKVLSQSWDMDLGGVFSRHDSTFGSDLKLQGFELNLNCVFLRDHAINPFIGFGVNSIESRRGGATVNKYDFGAQIKAGVLANLTSSGALQMSAEVGKRSDDLTQHLEDEFAAVGLRFNFGGKAAPAPVAAAPAPVAAPAPTPAPAPPPPPADSDRDGVNDHLDRCPNTPTGARVDAQGCELDSDRDGVVDRLDKCPNTPVGDKVDAVGCGLTIRLQVLFDNNSAEIKPAAYQELDGFVQFLKDVPSAKGTLEGHTDSQGSDAYNLKLSQRRAEAVRAYALSKGIDAARLDAKGYGESKPMADNNTGEGRAENRRVLFVRSDVVQ